MIGTLHEDIQKEAKTIPEILQKWETGIISKDSRVLTLDKLKEILETHLKEENRAFQIIETKPNKLVSSIIDVARPNQVGRIQMIETLLNSLQVAIDLLKMFDTEIAEAKGENAINNRQQTEEKK